MCGSRPGHFPPIQGSQLAGQCKWGLSLGGLCLQFIEAYSLFHFRQHAVHLQNFRVSPRSGKDSTSKLKFPMYVSESLREKFQEALYVVVVQHVCTVYIVLLHKFGFSRQTEREHLCVATIRNPHRWFRLELPGIASLPKLSSTSNSSSKADTGDSWPARSQQAAILLYLHAVTTRSWSFPMELTTSRPGGCAAGNNFDPRPANPLFAVLNPRVHTRQTRYRRRLQRQPAYLCDTLFLLLSRDSIYTCCPVW